DTPVTEQRLCIASLNNATFLDDVATMGDLKGFDDVLLCHEDSDPAPVDINDGIKYLVDQQRSQTKRGFIQQQQTWTCHECAANGQHLLLSAAECTRQLVLALF